MNKTGYIAIIILSALLSLLLFRMCYSNNSINKNNDVVDLIGGSTEPIIDSPTGEKIIPATNNKELNNFLSEGIANFDDATGWINSALREVNGKKEVSHSYGVYESYKNIFNDKENELERKKSSIELSRVALINAFNNSNRNDLQLYLTQSRNFIQESKALSTAVKNIVIAKPKTVVNESIVREQSNREQAAKENADRTAANRAITLKKQNEAEAKKKAELVVAQKVKEDAKRKATVKISDLYKSVINEISLLHEEITNAQTELETKRNQKLSERNFSDLDKLQIILNDTHNIYVTKAKASAESFRRSGSENNLTKLKNNISSNRINVSNIITSIRGMKAKESGQFLTNGNPLIPSGSAVYEKYQEVASLINTVEYSIAIAQEDINSKIASVSKSDASILDKCRNDLFKHSSSLNIMITRADQYNSSKSINSLTELKIEVEALNQKVNKIKETASSMLLIASVPIAETPKKEKIENKRRLPRSAYQAESLIKQITQTKTSSDIKDFKNLFRSNDTPCISGSFAGHIGDKTYSVSDYIRKCRLEGPKIVKVKNVELDEDGKIILMIIAETKIN